MEATIKTFVIPSLSRSYRGVYFIRVFPFSTLSVLVYNGNIRVLMEKWFLFKVRLKQVWNQNIFWRGMCNKLIIVFYCVNLRVCNNSKEFVILENVKPSNLGWEVKGGNVGRLLELYKQGQLI